MTEEEAGGLRTDIKETALKESNKIGVIQSAQVSSLFVVNQDFTKMSFCFTSLTNCSDRAPIPVCQTLC